MAQRTIIASDISGQEPAGTVTFALEGVSYEIDLTDQEKQELRTALDLFVSAGRRVGRSTAPTASRTRGAAGGSTGGTPAGVDPKSVRAWAACYEGLALPAQGRIPRSIVARYLDPTDKPTPVKGTDKGEIERQESIRARAQAAAA